MEYIKNFIITLVMIMIFSTAVELISPDNSMKKYIRFILGLILVAAMLNPIIYFFTKGEEDVIATIESYTNTFDRGEQEEVIDTSKDERIESFKSNLNKNCDTLLKNEFDNKKFTSNVVCTLDLNEMTYTIDKIEVGVEDTSVKIIDKIKINVNESKEAISDDERVENEESIKNYLAETFKIPMEKIEVYKWTELHLVYLV